MVAEGIQPVQSSGTVDLESTALLLYSQKFAKDPSEELSEFDTIYEGVDADDAVNQRSEDTILPSSRADVLAEVQSSWRKPGATLHIPGCTKQYQSRSGGTPTMFIPIGGCSSRLSANMCEDRYDLDGDVGMCQQCGLPLGDVSYYGEGNGEGPLVHAECYVDRTLRSFKKDEEDYQQEESTLKNSRRDEYDIGWRSEYIPSNMVHAGKLDCQLVPQGMCCLKTDEGFNNLSCWPTIEPAAAVNLEYLSIALKVRGLEGREPLFSLDPLEAVDSLDKNRMQVKRFEPEWLAGTSVGDVLFQADYHLKELSMGEYQQPVVGMKSCFDLSEIEGQKDKKWNAREWFLVRDAKVHLSEDHVLIPSVMMGIEAREQIITEYGLEDAPITRKDHPMVKYADAFTRNFDLIAERKSVMYHLRELAKASVIAKFLVDAQVQMEDSWFNLATAESDCCSLEIPQLWNERLYSKIRAQDGAVVKEDETQVGWHGVYGGVAFGLQKFDLTSVVPPPPPPVPHRIKGLLADPSKKPPLSITKPRLTLKANTITVPPPPAGAEPAKPAEDEDVDEVEATKDAAASLSTEVAPTALRTAPKKPVSLLGITPRPTTALLSQLPPVRQLSSSGKMPTIDMTAPVPGAAAIVPARAPTLRQITAPTPGAPLASTALATASIRGLPPPPGIGGPRRAAPSITPIKGTAPVPGGRAALLSGVPQIRSLKPIEPPSVTPVAAGISAAAGLMAVPGMATGLSAAIPGAMISTSGAPARGVDLNLDQFNLSTAEHQTGEVLGSVAEEVSVPIGASFWSELDQCASDTVFKKDDQKLLQEIFNPNLSDRREEGSRFTVPDSRFSYIGKLRCLIQEEADVRQKRNNHFLSSEFVAGNAGPLFPQSWTSNSELNKTEQVQKAMGARTGRLQVRSDYNDRARHIMESTTPIFDKTTEDGMRFRIYRVGSLEVRTTQQHLEDEVIGAVFSIRDPRSNEAGSGQQAQFNIDDSEVIVKATEYVERASPTGNDDVECCYYVLLETQDGNIIISEKLGGHPMASWVENPSDVEDRISLAKVIRSGDCRVAGVTVRDMKSERASASFGEGPSKVWSQRRCRLYAQDMFVRAMGGLDALLLRTRQ